ncbi:hypothetical protein chiPu_0026283 [Chiloscyllium punctatum]|uniref:Uncharacterized protein n=1 Tax=Chiloscyllium punctatum TaxID=137246 RepID=A0A401TID6_CHIPU|nr:hypothetical protein [Chiloscyllium punctatum]
MDTNRTGTGIERCLAKYILTTHKAGSETDPKRGQSTELTQESKTTSDGLNEGERNSGTRRNPGTRSGLTES